MSDPLSITAGVIAIVTVTIQSTTALYRTVESFKSYPKRVAELKNQLWALINVLRSLEALTREDRTACALLESPLRQCGRACQEFKDLLENCRQKSNSGRLSLSEWMKLRYRNGDIVSFIESLAGYKSTIGIAIADTNFSRLGVDATTRYLEDHLEEVLSRLEWLTPPANEESLSENTDLSHMADEKTSTEKCLQICRQFQVDLDKMQFQIATIDRSSSTTRNITTLSARSMTLATTMTLSSLKACGMEITDTVSKLLLHQEKMKEKLLAEPEKQLRGQAEAHELQVQRLQHELDSVKQLLSFCRDASSRATPNRVHVLENINVGDGSQQLCVSTVGDLFKINGATAGRDSLQLFGSISAEPLRDIIRLHKDQHANGNKQLTQEEICNSSSSGGSRAI
ncbi:hypothetical protein S7711_10158 [Stachybotrys chartarum IBT 7711]|uniref:Azaphilone pigments biosynthesis cluster protein L N-terminal domain-containing protein n=1 Tax=Stachybotrys chartarum (strain CBS 109288 / IBT 7711) TaxID=1280523 RepID=A0A084B6R6_STACB|nr:hypothetical protein S7711_10158 [Stachybotrys chartarum IBT 7711]KFA79426.1 hypothetical protein S40288_09880 [Stachybotrys chartarum IBT 40288]